MNLQADKENSEPQDHQRTITISKPAVLRSVPDLSRQQSKAAASFDSDSEDEVLPSKTKTPARRRVFASDSESEEDEPAARSERTPSRDALLETSSMSQAIKMRNRDIEDPKTESEGEGYSLCDESAIKAQGALSDHDSGSEYDQDLSSFIVDGDEESEGAIEKNYEQARDVHSDDDDDEEDGDEGEDLSSEGNADTDDDDTVDEEEASFSDDSDLDDSLDIDTANIQTTRPGKRHNPPVNDYDSPPIQNSPHVHVKNSASKAAAKQKSAPETPAAFRRKCSKLTEELFEEYNRRIFDHKLTGVLVVWSKRLNTTAGRAHLEHKGEEYTATIELSTKVVDSHAKLRNTLCHEMCHAMQWLDMHTCKPAHGPAFKLWAHKAMKEYPDLRITTCHNYDIDFKFKYRCQTGWCNRVIGRHSNSIDVSKKGCGACGGRLELMPRLKADGTPMKKRQASAFSLSVNLFSCFDLLMTW